MAQQVAQEVLLEDSLAREGPLDNPSCEFFFFPRETFAKCMLGPFAEIQFPQCVNLEIQFKFHKWQC